MKRLSIDPQIQSVQILVASGFRLMIKKFIGGIHDFIHLNFRQWKPSSVSEAKSQKFKICIFRTSTSVQGLPDLAFN